MFGVQKAISYNVAVGYLGSKWIKMLWKWGRYWINSIFSAVEILHFFSKFWYVTYYLRKYKTKYAGQTVVSNDQVSTVLLN